jgi:vacuolar iron transporter family protein
VRVHTRRELGVDPEELPSPLTAGIASLFAFSFGALIPLLPWLIGAPHLWVALALTAVGLTALGAAAGRLTGRPVQRSGLCQPALGALAIAVTYGVGHLIGAAPGPAPASVRALAGAAAAVRRM